MRLLVQRCLILGLCCLFSTFPGVTVADPAPSGWSAYGYSYRCGGGGTVNGDTTNAAGKAQTYYDQKKACQIDNLQAGLTECRASHTLCDVYDIEDKPPYPHNGNIRYSYYKSIFYTDQECTDPVSFEPGGPDTSGNACPQHCLPGYVQTEAPYNPNAGTEYSTGFDCMVERTNEECQELGKAKVDSQFGSYCVNECAHGVFNGVCLQPPEDDPECSKDSPDYRGEVVLGYGQDPIPACGDFDQCSGDQPGQVGFVNGELRCIPEDYGVPECKGDTITVIDEYGFVCESLQNKPEDPETPEDPNTDTDGDGEPDEYDPDNDPNINRKQLDDLKDGQATANQSLSNLENLGKGTNKRLDGIGEGIDKGNKELGRIEANTGKSATELEVMNEKLDDPDSGYDTSSLGDAPTFAESSERLKTSIATNPTIQAVTTIPSISSNNTCPVWTIPSTQFWEAMPIDSHCQILSDHRGLLSMLFIAVWTLAAVFVFLRA